MAKKARVYDGTAWQELASAQTDLTAYSTTAQMNTAITAGVGLVPILTQTIGTAVSSVTVTSAFSATYDNYKIIISGGVGSTSSGINLTLGSTTAGYYRGGTYTFYSGSTVAGINTSNGASWANSGLSTTSAIAGNIELQSPFLSKTTVMSSVYASTATSGEGLQQQGFLNDTTSYTSFTLTTVSGTLTGGTIKVYGYKN